MIRGLSIASVVIGLITISLAGCASEGTAPRHGLTVEKAKRAVLAEEKRIAAVIPKKYVARQDQLATAHLLSCSGGAYKWPGQGDVVLKGSPNISALLSQIAHHYQTKPGYSVKIGKTGDGAEMVTISSKDGNFYVSPTVSEVDVEISSFSACFELGDDQWAGDSY